MFRGHEKQSCKYLFIFFDRNAIQTVLVSNSFMELLSDMNNLEYAQ